MFNPPTIRKPHLVKRYSVGRLYDTTDMKYTDVAQLRAMARDGTPVVVLDAKSGDDMTDSFLRLDR